MNRARTAQSAVAVLAVLALTGPARASQVHVMPLLQVAANINVVIEMEVLQTREWKDERTLANGMKVVDGFHWEIVGKVVHTHGGEGPKPGTRLTLHRAMPSAVVYDEQGNVKMSMSFIVSDMGPDGGVNKGDRILACFRKMPDTKAKFVTAERTLHAKKLPELQTAMHRCREFRRLVRAVRAELPDGWKLTQPGREGDIAPAIRYANPGRSKKGAVGLEIIAVGPRSPKPGAGPEPAAWLWAMPADYPDPTHKPGSAAAMPEPKPDRLRRAEHDAWLGGRCLSRIVHVPAKQADALAERFDAAALAGARAEALSRGFHMTLSYQPTGPGGVALTASYTQLHLELEGGALADPVRPQPSGTILPTHRITAAIAALTDLRVLSQAELVKSDSKPATRPAGKAVPTLTVRLRAGHPYGEEPQHLRYQTRDPERIQAILKALSTAVGPGRR